MPKLYLAFVSILMLAALGFAVACGDDEQPSEEEARAALCGDLEQLDLAITTFMELDTESTVGEVRAARDGVKEAADAVVSSAEDVEEAETAELQEAAHNLDESIDEIQDDQTVQQVLDAVSVSAQNVAAAQQQLYTDLSCEDPPPTGEAEPTEPVTVEPSAAETAPAETAVPTESVDATETTAPDETAVPTESEATEPVPTTGGE